MRGGVSRRIAAWVTAAAALVSLGGCAVSPREERISLRVCLAASAATYDTIYARQGGDQTVLFHLYENLMRLERDESGQLRPVPAAAKSVDTTDNADGTVTYTFRLREAKWSDGREVRASDFVYAWQRLADPRSASGYAALLSCIQGYDAARAAGDMSLLAVEAKNSATLSVTLTGQYELFLSQVCTAVATMPLRQDVVYRLKQAAEDIAADLPEGREGPKWCDDPTALVTNGPYTAQSAEPGVSLTLTANEEEGRWPAAPGEIVFRFADPDTAQTLYDGGEADLIWPLPDETVEQLRLQDPAWQGEAALSTYCVLFNCEQILDVVLRRALSLALDRSAIALLAGTAAFPAEGLVPPGVPGGEETFREEGGASVATDEEGYAQRCREAAALLQAAGYDLSGDGQTLEYLYIDDGENAAVAAAVCRMWRSVLGLEVIPRGMSRGELAQALSSGSYTLAGSEIEAVTCDAESFLRPWISDAPDNLLHYENSAYDTLMSIIAGAKDPAARMGCLHDAEDLLLELDCALAPLYTKSTGWSLRADYTGAVRDLRGWFDFTGVTPRPQTAG